MWQLCPHRICEGISFSFQCYLFAVLSAPSFRFILRALANIEAPFVPPPFRYSAEITSPNNNINVIFRNKGSVMAASQLCLRPGCLLLLVALLCVLLFVAIFFCLMSLYAAICCSFFYFLLLSVIVAAFCCLGIVCLLRLIFVAIAPCCCCTHCSLLLFFAA